MTDSRVLDSTWTRVEQFDAAGPSSRKDSSADAMQVDGDDEDEDETSEWEYEDTEELVTLDLGPESKRLLQMSHQYSITGLETSNQIFLRLGNVMFKGHWDTLIGTEILLRDTKDTSRSSQAGNQHHVSPLPATETDIRTGRAPSTTRHRIQFLPAVNMMAREEALREQGGQSLITHKGGWVWIRGKGWIRKDQINNATNEEDHDEGEEAGETKVKAKARAAPPTKKLGRKKMTSEEKMRYSIWKSLQKIDKNKEGQAVEEQVVDEDEDEEDDDDNEESDNEEAEVGSLVQGNGVS